MGGSPSQSKITPARALLIYVIVVFIGGALLAPWVFYGLKALAPHWDFANNVAGKPFRALVNRTVYLVALIGMWPLIRALKIGSWREIGWWVKPGWFKELASGAAFGAALLLIAAAAAVFMGGAKIANPNVASKLPSIILTAVFVAILEETFFRGAIFSVLRRASTETKALWATSAIYAIFHFFARPVSPTDIHWNSGLIILAKMLSGFVDPKLVLPGFLSLTLLGVIFNLAFLRTGALYVSIGIHAAAIFWSKLYLFAFDVPEGAGAWFWGTEKITDGWFCFLLLLGAAIFFWKRKP